MMPMASSMAPLHSLGQDDSNEVQHDIFGHVRPLELVLALQKDTGIKIATLLSLYDDNQNEMHMTFWSFEATGTAHSVTSCQQHHQ